MITLWFLLLAAPDAGLLPGAGQAPAAAPISVRADGPHRYVVGATSLDLNLWAKSCRIIPHHEEGKLVGLKLAGIRPTSPVAALGFQNGDVVQTLAGLPLTSPGKALEAYSKVMAGGNVVVEVVRKGEPLTLTYVIEPSISAGPTSASPTSASPPSGASAP
jgi:membrane-associated protease RseP (regulator of RpoE activity)